MYNYMYMHMCMCEYISDKKSLYIHHATEYQLFKAQCLLYPQLCKPVTDKLQTVLDNYLHVRVSHLQVVTSKFGQPKQC